MIGIRNGVGIDMSVVTIIISIALLTAVIALLPDFPSVPLAMSSPIDQLLEWCEMIAEVGQYIFSQTIWNFLVVMMMIHLVAIPIWQLSQWIFNQIMKAKS